MKNGSRYSLIPWPEMAVCLAELGFIVDYVDGEGPDGAPIRRLTTRKTSIIVRRYREGDEEAIRDLFQRSFHHELRPEQWRWRYRDNPLGALRISVALADDGQLIGHYGGYPVSFQHGAADDAAHTLIAHQNGDVMTDRRARRLGHGGATLVGRLAQHFWAAYGEGRVDFHYGFNTDTARTLQQRIVPGVRALEDVSVWMTDAVRRPTASAPPDATPGGSHGSDGELRAERVSRFDAAWDAFAQRARAAYGLLARRDSAYLNWRYATRPASDDVIIIVRRRDQQIVGGAVFQLHADETRWGDALFDPRQPAAVAVALDHLRTLGAPPRIRAWFPARPDWWTRILIDLGFHQEREPHGLTLVYAPFTPAAERLLPHLYYAWGDSDLF